MGELQDVKNYLNTGLVCGTPLVIEKTKKDNGDGKTDLFKVYKIKKI